MCLEIVMLRFPLVQHGSQKFLFFSLRTCLSTTPCSFVDEDDSSKDRRKLGKLIKNLADTQSSESVLENFLSKTTSQMQTNKSKRRRKLKPSNVKNEYIKPVIAQTTVDRESTPKTKIHVSVTKSKLKDKSDSLKAPLTEKQIENLREELRVESQSAIEVANRLINGLNAKTEKPAVIDAKMPSQCPSKGVRFDTGDSTSLFPQERVARVSEAVEPYVSLFEIQQKEQLVGLLPQCEPENAFEVSMLSMDRQWQFPINNEQDMGVEDETTFDQHVFLDHLLEQFPDNDQVQKFMELVVTGLQQNPYLTVDQKEKQILWFKDYFEKVPKEDWISQL